MIKRLTAAVLAVFILLSTVHTKVYAFELYDTFYDWVADFVNQANVQRNYSELYGYYKSIGLSNTEAKAMALTTTGAYTTGKVTGGLVKLEFSGLSATLQGRLIDFYTQVKDGTGDTNYYSIDNKDVYDILRVFDKETSKNIEEDTRSGYGRSVRIMYVDKFLSDVLKPLANKYNSPAMDFKPFLTVVYNRRFISVYKSTTQSVTSATKNEPLGYVNVYFEYFATNPDGFPAIPAKMLSQTIDGSHQYNSTYQINGDVQLYDYQMRDKSYSWSGFGTTVAKSGYFNGKLTGVDYYYILYQEPDGYAPEPIELLTNLYINGPSYSNQKNYYYEYNPENINEINNYTYNYNYVQDDNWVSELLKLLDGNKSEYVYNITINNYYENGGNDNQGGGTTNNYYNEYHDHFYTENYYNEYNDHFYDENYYNEYITNEYVTNEYVTNEYTTNEYVTNEYVTNEYITNEYYGGEDGTVDNTQIIILLNSLREDIKNMQSGIESALDKNGKNTVTMLESMTEKIVNKLSEILENLGIQVEQAAEERLLLIVIMVTLMLMLLIWLVLTIWRFFYSHMIHVWI